MFFASPLFTMPFARAAFSSLALVAASVLTFLCCATYAEAASKKATAPKPAAAPTAIEALPTVRVALVQGAEFTDDVLLLQSIVRGLHAQGLVGGVTPDLYKQHSMESLWNWLATHTNGKVRFLGDAFYHGHRDINKRSQNKGALRERIATKKDVDLILAVGTPAGVDMVKDMQPLPVLVVGATDPVAAGIVASVKDSGRDNVHAAIEVSTHIQQLLLFKEIFDFSTLGICYENTKEGRAIIAYEELRKAALQGGFTLVEGIIADFTDNEDSNIDLRTACHRNLAGKAEAVYLVVGPGNSRNRYKDLLAPLLAAKIPTFSQNGEKDVEAGALLSFNSTNVTSLGYFEAQVIRQVMEGKKPREINQFFSDSTGLALNVKNASEIGWRVPTQLLTDVDIVYARIHNVAK